MHDDRFRPGRRHNDRGRVDMTRRCVDDHPGRRMDDDGRRRTNDHRRWSVNDYHWSVNDHWRWDNYPRGIDDGSMNHHRRPGKMNDRSPMMTRVDDTSGADHRERRRAAQPNKSKHFHRVLFFRSADCGHPCLVSRHRGRTYPAAQSIEHHRCQKSPTRRDFRLLGHRP